MHRRHLNILVTGGFEANFVLGFAKGLAANGVDIFVVSCDDTASALNAAKIPNRNLRGAMNVRRSVWSKMLNLFRYYVLLLALLVRNRGATVHYIGLFRNGLILWEGLGLNILFRALAGRYLYTVHNVLPHSRERSRFFRWIYRWIYRIPHILLMHTERAREQLAGEFGVPSERLHLTSLGLNEEVPAPEISRHAARAKIGIAGERPLLLFFGKIDQYKGLDVLLAAFERLSSREVRLVVAGEFRNAAYAQEIKAQWQKMTRKEDVLFFERFIPNEEVGFFFEACDVLCLPYRHIYQSGLVFLAPRFGLPMIATDVGMLREFIGNTMGWIAPSNDVDGLVSALESFLATPNAFPRHRILERAEPMRWSNVCRSLVALYARRPDSGQSSTLRHHPSSAAHNNF